MGGRITAIESFGFDRQRVELTTDLDRMRRPRFIAIHLLAGMVAAGASSVSADASPTELLKAYGLQPFGSATRAVDFRLPALDGGELSLSDFQGEWVILTFWASWCGPCRIEMPSLETLHRERGDHGLVVLGVSLDNEIEAARSFVEGIELSFPLLWDERGTVGRDYKASAIPMSYLIDPQGGLVGVATGARDWGQIVPLIDTLQGLPIGTGLGEAVYAESGTVGVPEVLDPPTADLVLSNSAPEVGQEFELEIRLRWAGSLEEYLPQTPKVHLPEGVSQTRVRASSDSRDGSQIVTYRASLRADTPGSFALDPVELRYMPRLAASPVTTRLVGPTVEVQPRTVAGVRPGTLAMGAGGLVVATVLGLAAGVRWRHARSAPNESPDESFESLEVELANVKRLRMQGNSRESVLALIDLANRIGSDGGLGEGGLDALEESVRYGGVVPPKENRERLQRVIERQLDSMRPDPDDASRLALRLRGKTS